MQIKNKFVDKIKKGEWDHSKKRKGSQWNKLMKIGLNWDKTRF